MKITVARLRELVKEAVMVEFGSPRGAMRRPGRSSSGGRQFKIGRVEEENRELSYNEADAMFPGSTEAWVEIATLGDDFPELKGLDPTEIKRRSLWFRIGKELRVAISPFPQVELMRWDPERADWFDLDYAA